MNQFWSRCHTFHVLAIPQFIPHCNNNILFLFKYSHICILFIIQRRQVIFIIIIYIPFFIFHSEIAQLIRHIVTLHQSNPCLHHIATHINWRSFHCYNTFITHILKVLSILSFKFNYFSGILHRIIIKCRVIGTILHPTSISNNYQWVILFTKSQNRIHISVLKLLYRI